MPSVPTCVPIKNIPVGATVLNVLVSGSCLFIGLDNGRILMWSEPGEIKAALTEHTSQVLGLLQCEDTLWSGSDDKTIKLWDISTGKCVKTLQSNSICLREWKGHVISGGDNVTDHDPFLCAWSKDGSLVTKWEAAERVYNTFSLVEWKGLLCSGHDTGAIIKWNDFDTKRSMYVGHTEMIYQLIAVGDYLFSGSHDRTIKKWNMAEECLVIFKQHSESVISICLHNGEICSTSADNTVKRWTLDGSLVKEYKGHTATVWAIATWRGALFSGASDEQLIQWTDFSWSPTTHPQFPANIREGIKTVMLLAHSKALPAQILPLDLLLVIFQYYSRSSSDIPS